MSPGGADRYANLEVRIVSGHNPDLVITEPVKKRIDMTTYASENELHALVLEEGFVLRTDSALQNKDDRCFAWRETGQCLKTPVYMRENCALACGVFCDAF